MSGDKYKELDEAIVLKISIEKANTFTLIACGRLGKLADTFAAPDRHGFPEGWRVIDRRLQALRKAKKIAYSRKSGWSTP